MKSVIALEDNEIVLYMTQEVRAYFAPFRIFGEEKEGLFRKKYDKTPSYDEMLEEVLNWAVCEFIILNLSLGINGMPIPPDKIYNKLDSNFAFKVIVYGAVHDYVLNYEGQRFAEVKGSTVQAVDLRKCIMDICKEIDIKRVKRLVEDDFSLKELC